MPERPRPPAVAGQFYAADPAELAHEVEACFLDPRGPGELPPRQRSPERKIRAAIVPHAGYRYSGPIAAHVYRELSKERPPAATLILGVDHHGTTNRAALSDRPWRIPFGPVEVDHLLVRSLARPPLTVDESAHALEHSIEVQLPLLDYVMPHPLIAALTVPFGPFDALMEIADVVRTAIEGRDVLLLASTDFSHYVPVSEAQRLDQHALDRILATDAGGLFRTVVDERISMCGIAPTTVLLSLLKDDGSEPTLLRWGHSGEAETMKDVVGYAGVVWRSPVPLLS
ncbi:MAG: AmmeMemoRadiSam system protein B [Thermoplasmata archaeon]